MRIRCTWELQYGGDYYYSPPKINSITETTIGQLSVYPNPFTNSITFSLAHNNSKFIIEIYDIQGRRILSKSVTNHETINLEHLDTGVYVYSINVDGSIIKGKIIKN